MAFAVILAVVSASANAQIKLENTIKKVETYVADDGEVKRRFVDAHTVVPGDELRYTVRFTNSGDKPVDAGTIVITDAVPAHTAYMDGTAYGSGAQVQFSVDGQAFAPPHALQTVKDGMPTIASAADYQAIRWVFEPALEPGASSYVSFNVRLK
jgi:uncharacterized repeat protein (TIGR01451 family)